MAKELPYFKFFCSEWNDGDITLESFKIQGLFINVCSYYWSNECDLSMDKLHKRFKKSNKELIYLEEIGAIKVENEQVLINFLLEQSKERKTLSTQNSLNAKERWKKKSDRNATASNPQSENHAIKRREEKRRKDNTDITSFWDSYHALSEKPKTDLEASNKHWVKLTEAEKNLAIENIKPYVDSVNDKKFIVKARTYLSDKKFNDEFTSSGKKNIVILGGKEYDLGNGETYTS